MVPYCHLIMTEHVTVKISFKMGTDNSLVEAVTLNCTWQRKIRRRARLPFVMNKQPRTLYLIHRPPSVIRDSTQPFSAKPTLTPGNARTHSATGDLLSGASICPRDLTWEWLEKLSDWIGVKGPTGNPQEGLVLPLHMLKVVNVKTSPYHCLLTSFLAHCCRVPDIPLQ